MFEFQSIFDLGKLRKKGKVLRRNEAGEELFYLVLKVHKIENFFDSDFGICVISLLVMSKY